MSILNLLIVTLFSSYLWYDVFEIQFKIKKLLKIPAHQSVKPWDCYTCTNGWVGIFLTIICLIIFLPSGILEWVPYIQFVFINYLIGHYIDHLKHL